MPKKARNLVGQKFGRLLVVEYSHTKDSGLVWKCLCDCGNITYVGTSNLVFNRHTKSCGCITREKSNVIGKKFNKLTILEKIGRNNRGLLLVKSKCDCGNFHSSTLHGIKSGKTKSCGCLVSLAHPRRGQKLQNHHNWRHDLSEEERLESKNRSTNPELKEWRRQVYERDKYTCRKCGGKEGRNLNAHHLYSWETHKGLRFDVENGITLCNKCHKNFHKNFGYRKNTKEQFDQWIEKKEYSGIATLV